VYHLHSPDSQFGYSAEIVDTLEEIRREGKIRFYGLSLIPPERGQRPSEQGMDVLNTGRRCDFFQLVYNILEREAEEYFLSECAQRNLGVIVRVPLQSGFLSGKYTAETRFPKDDVRSVWYTPQRIREQVAQVNRLSFLVKGEERTLAQAALQFCLAQPVVSTVIAGARRPEQVVLNAQVSDLPPLTEGELRKIVMEIPPKQAFG